MRRPLAASRTRTPLLGSATNTRPARSSMANTLLTPPMRASTRPLRVSSIWRPVFVLIEDSLPSAQGQRIVEHELEEQVLQFVRCSVSLVGGEVSAHNHGVRERPSPGRGWFGGPPLRRVSWCRPSD